MDVRSTRSDDGISMISAAFPLQKQPAPPVILLTPDPALATPAGDWRPALAALQAVLATRDITIETVAWTEASPAALARAPLVLPLLAWGYQHDPDRWQASLVTWAQAGVRLANPAALLAWNSDKAYLQDLAQRSAPVAPAIFVDRLTIAALNAAADRFGTPQLVAKPAISATAFQTIRWQPGDGLAGGPAGRALIRPSCPQSPPTANSR